MALLQTLFVNQGTETVALRDSQGFYKFVSTWFLCWMAFRPLLDMLVWGLGKNLSIFSHGSISVQSFLGLITIGIGWAHLFVRRNQISLLTKFIGGLILIGGGLAAFQDGLSFVGLSYWLRLQVWLVLILVLNDLAYEPLYYQAYIKWGFLGSLIFTVAVLTDLMVTGGRYCTDHFVGEIGGNLFFEHEFSALVTLIPFGFLMVVNPKNKSLLPFLVSVLAIYPFLIGWTFVRSTWLGSLALAITLVLNFRHSKVLSFIGLLQMILFGIFVAMSLPSQQKRFTAEIGAKQVLVNVLNPSEDKHASAGMTPNNAVLPNSSAKQPSLYSRISNVWENRAVVGKFLSRMGSGRIGIWTHHLTVWWNWPLRAKLFGRGPYSGERFGHVETISDFIRILLDLGLVGLFLVGFIAIKLFRFTYIQMTDDQELKAIKVVAKAGIIAIITVGVFSGALLANSKAWYFAMFLGCVLGRIRYGSLQREAS